MRAKYLGNGEGRQPKEISQLLGSIIEKAAVGIDVRHGQLVNDWQLFAPHDWVTFATPVGVRDGTLLVEVLDGSAASLLKYQTGELTGAIGDRFGGDLVHSVKIRVRQG
ncbi:MAG: DUF721 domain-containing protein [Acidimicrobiia bacterium]|nr:DUF721 domain-containing protein [Acidimicrobiia bacterium]